MRLFIKNLVIFFVLFALMLMNSPLFAAETHRIKDVNFDISGNIIFVPIKTNLPQPITDDITYTALEDKNGVLLKINSAITDRTIKDAAFSDSNIKEFSIEQEKDGTKITMIFKDNYNLANLKIGAVKNNLIITISPVQPYDMNYYTNTYRDIENHSKDYKNELIITTKNIETQQTLPVNNASTGSLNEINQAFSKSTNSESEVYTNITIEDLTKDNKLRTKYYLANALEKDNVFRITGVGAICIQKPFVLSNPARMVFDLQNTMINPELHGKEITLQNGDVLKLAQFTPSTTRLVVSSNDAPQYIPVYSPDSQGILLANPRNILTTHLPNYKTNIVKFNFQKSNKVNNFLFEFDKPLSYAIKRTNDYLFIYFLNAEKYNDSNFHAAIKNTPYSDLSIHLLSTGMRVKIPLANKDDVRTCLSPEGKLFRISSEQKKEEPKVISQEKIKELTKKEGGIKSSPKNTDNKTSNVIVIDAGHGGKDCGALRGTITEKAINLEVCMRLQSILQKKGYKVYMTRTDDTYVSLEDRTVFTEGINPAVFVSVHVNSCNADGPKGIETHYYHENSLELADSVHKNLIKKVSNTTNRGLFKSRFYVINHTTVPAILVEIGFISNTAERQELISPARQQATAEGIAEGIIEFIKNEK